MNELNSDQLRKKLSKHVRKINWLTEQNDLIVAALKLRGLQAVDPAGDDISIHPCIMQLDKLQSEPKPLTADELKAGGWWCAEAGKEVEQELARRNVIIMSKKWRQKSHIYGCMSVHPRIASQFVEPKWTLRLRQIHRIGDTFYWGAPNG